MQIQTTDSKQPSGPAPPAPTIAPPAYPGTGEPGPSQPPQQGDSSAPPHYTFQAPAPGVVPQNGAPVITNVTEGETVYQRILLINGRAGPLSSESYVSVANRGFPTVTWPAVDSYFKALVHLEPGPNTISITYHSLTPTSGPLTTLFHVTYIPLLQTSPLHLVILLAADSRATFDVPPQKQSDNTLDVAITKFRLAGYMWQAFCAEQLYRNGFGRRTFRLVESYEPDTLSSQDPKGTVLRQTAHVHVIRSRRTLAEILDPDIAQQNPHMDPKKPDLFSFFLDALREHGAPFDKQCYVAGLVLDTKWDPKLKLVRGHAALGGGAGHIQLGIFGSHSLHAWPRYFEEIERCFMDATKTDTKFVANDAGESGEWWKAANVGMGAMLHEVGHAHTLTHTATGIMSRGFNNWNRTFMVKEPHHSGAIGPHDEAGSHWHRCDILRLRFHPSFRHSLDDTPPDRRTNIAPSFIPLESGLEISAPAGLTLVELILNDRYKSHIEFPDPESQPTLLPVTAEDLWRRAGAHPGDGRLRVEVTSANQHTTDINDLGKFLQEHIVTVPGVPGTVIKSAPAGNRGLDGVETRVVFPSGGKGPVLVRISIYFGDYLNGLVFFFSDKTTKAIGVQKGSKREIEFAPDEHVVRVIVRAGAWMDGIEVETTKGRTSKWCGGSGGSMRILEAPEGYELIGMYGTAKDWMDSVGIMYRRSSGTTGVRTIAREPQAVIGRLLPHQSGNMGDLPGIPSQFQKSTAVGHRGLHGAETSAFFHLQDPALVGIRVHYGDYLDGMAFLFANGTQSVFGHAKGGNERKIDFAPDERVARFLVGAGAWIDRIDIQTTKGRSTGWCGGSGGNVQILEAPEGCELIGIHGTVGDWLDSVGIIYAEREGLRPGIATPMTARLAESIVRCPHCTFDNPVGRTECDVCQLPINE